MSVYVLTKARPFCEEEFVGVFKTSKAAEKHIRSISQYAKPEGSGVFVIMDTKLERTMYFVRLVLVSE